MAHAQEQIISLVPKAKDAQVQLELDLDTEAVLMQLVLALEASSVGEVIRRAVQAYEIFEPVNDDQVVPFQSETNWEYIRKKSLHVRLPARTKERLDRAKTETGSTYSEVVTRSVQVLAQLVRNRELLRDSEHDTTGYSQQQELLLA